MVDDRARPVQAMALIRHPSGTRLRTINSVPTESTGPPLKRAGELAGGCGPGRITDNHDADRTALGGHRLLELGVGRQVILRYWLESRRPRLPSSWRPRPSAASPPPDRPC